MVVSAFVREQFLLILVGAGGRRRRRSSCGSGSRARRPASIAPILRVPVVGEIAGKFATSQMARTLATLLGGGLPLVNALEIAARSVGNQYIASELDVVTHAGARRAVVRRRARGARTCFPTWP